MMYNFAILNDDERRAIFENSASKLKMNSAIIEKDFWVCYVLDYLFHKCKYKNSFAFKGGTCLSKVFNIIDRFSEDIDLILDWEVLGYKREEPWEVRSNEKQNKFNKEAINRQNEYMKKELLPLLESELIKPIGNNSKVYIDDADPGTIKFSYPKTLHNDAILQEIRLEIGALAAWTPITRASVKPYIDDCYPDLLQYKNIEVLATTDVRTFWEKATILHQEANRPINSNMPPRYSRHYYDLYCMVNKKVDDKALKEKDLLRKVADFKEKFYPRKWAEYDRARIGTLKLMPAVHSINTLRKDYAKMKSMIFGYYPNFDELMNKIKEVESKINNA